ncbi:unnamed protein product [Pleuronectes platessa]|uniref:Uncharacterized protein n=1 Tax=Pleuronectes platessa TaxID=8262 RepID=A0A9N7VYI6_PLEPL|nr:unnamed protein product [Pleuronectes platessa]
MTNASFSTSEMQPGGTETSTCERQLESGHVSGKWGGSSAVYTSHLLLRTPSDATSHRLTDTLIKGEFQLSVSRCSYLVLLSRLERRMEVTLLIHRWCEGPQLLGCGRDLFLASCGDAGQRQGSPKEMLLSRELGEGLVPCLVMGQQVGGRGGAYRARVSSDHLIQQPPHLPRVNAPKPPEPANEGPRQTDPHDTQTNAARRMAHRNTSHVPRRECKTSCARQHLGGRCTSGRKMWRQQGEEGRAAAARFGMGARDACVNGPWLRQQFCGWKERRSEGVTLQRRRQSAIQSRALCGKAWRLHSAEGRGVVPGLKFRALRLSLVWPLALTPPLPAGHSWVPPTGVLSATCQTEPALGSGAESLAASRTLMNSPPSETAGEWEGEVIRQSPRVADP